jgi:UDP-N-acetylmuramate: L-alanyl-gamma-D-glutamyl-meso-diaminopimelate ligase
MPDSTKTTKFHFIGICGTAMGSVAVALQQAGHRVTGSDENVYPPMSTYLAENGVQVSEGFAAENIPRDAEVVVIGNAMSRGNAEVESVLNRRLYYLSLPEVLKGWFLRGKRNLVVCGTHGKTTTTSMLSWLLEHAGGRPNFMIGGIPRNFRAGARLNNDSPYFVVEGDEYDTAFFDKRSKFVHYLPEVVIINNIEFDHADIFPDLEAIKLSFSRLVRIIPQNGALLINGDDPNCEDVLEEARCPILRVGFGENCNIRVTDFTETAEGARFRLNGEEMMLPQQGEFNARNAAMALTAARRVLESGPAGTLRRGLSLFEGVARRMEVRLDVGGVLVIDDFGHHPTAIRATIRALRRRYENRRIWALFEPRSNTTRRAVFQQKLPEALGEADGVMVSKVARLEQIPEAQRLNPEAVVAAIRERGSEAFYQDGPEEIVRTLKPRLRDQDVVVVFSNGGFGGLHEMLREAIEERAAAGTP